MTGRFDHLPNRRAIVDRRALAEALAALPTERPPALRRAADARAAATRSTRAAPRSRGAWPRTRRAGSRRRTRGAYLTDQLLRALFDFTIERLYPLANPTAGERLPLIAVGGYGRGEMAPHSDVDIAFLTPGSRPAGASR